VPRKITARTIDDYASLVGASLASLALTTVVYEYLMAWSGGLGYGLCWWATFVAIYGVVTAMSQPVPIVLDRVVSVLVASGAAVLVGILFAILFKVTREAWPVIWHWNFWTEDMQGIRPLDPVTKGGVYHAIVGSAIEVGIAVAIALPLGIGTAVYMSEVGGRLATVVRTVVEAMTALPDILAGLFVYVFLVVGFHMPRSGFAAALALTVTMIPVLARSAEVVLRVVPSGLREASMALGASQWSTIRSVVLPTARAGLATSLILGVARIAGETAPLLIVTGTATTTNYNPFKDTMNSLPLYIYDAVRSGQPLLIERAFGAAFVLLFLVLVLFILARVLSSSKRY